MNCPNCRERTDIPLTCCQCGSTYCKKCNPHYDYEGDVCQACQERNSIEAIREHGWTERLRRWFHKTAPLPEEPSKVYPLPWRVERDGHEWVLVTDTGMTVGRFDDIVAAGYACDAVNAHYELSMVAALTYNRIRAGDPFWSGTKRDCELWQRVRKLLK